MQIKITNTTVNVQVPQACNAGSNPIEVLLNLLAADIPCMVMSSNDDQDEILEDENLEGEIHLSHKQPEQLEWSSEMITIFSPYQAYIMRNDIFHNIFAEDIHDYLKDVTPPTLESIDKLNASNYHELLDQIAAAMEVLDEAGTNLSSDGSIEYEEAVIMSAAALIALYGYDQYILVNAVVNQLAKVEYEQHG
jgi:hypothetical protein